MKNLNAMFFEKTILKLKDGVEHFLFSHLGFEMFVSDWMTLSVVFNNFVNNKSRVFVKNSKTLGWETWQVNYWDDRLFESCLQKAILLLLKKSFNTTYEVIKLNVQTWISRDLNAIYKKFKHFLQVLETSFQQTHKVAFEFFTSYTTKIIETIKKK